MPVVLVEEAGAALGGRHAGLYHYALRFEERRELARAVRRLASTHTRTSPCTLCSSACSTAPTAEPATDTANAGGGT